MRERIYAILVTNPVIAITVTIFQNNVSILLSMCFLTDILIKSISVVLAVLPKSVITSFIAIVFYKRDVKINYSKTKGNNDRECDLYLNDKSKPLTPLIFVI